MRNIDWALLQSFITVTEHGSFSAAARAINGSQATLSRHITILEQRLDIRLFERVVSGVELTSAGLDVLRYATEMADAAGRLSMAIEGKDDTISGTIRVTAATMMATYVLPQILTDLRAEEPLIDIELVASNKTENLIRREADIAVRMVNPTQDNLFARKLGEAEFGLYASNEYIDRHSIPQSVEELRSHNVIGFDTSDLIITAMKRYGLEIDREFFAFRSDDHIACWKMVLSGFGLGVVQRVIGDAEPRVSRINLPHNMGKFPIWLIAHSELKTNSRVRRVFDFLAEGLRAVHSVK